MIFTIHKPCYNIVALLTQVILCCRIKITRKVVGTWLNPNGTVFCELMKDGTGIDSNGRFFTWKLSDDTLIRIYPHNGNVQQSTYDEETDTIKLPGGTLTRQK